MAGQRSNRTRVGYALVALSFGWAVFVVATLGSAEERYFQTCTGSCLAEMPDSYVLEHALFGIVFVGLPVALALRVVRSSAVNPGP